MSAIELTDRQLDQLAERIAAKLAALQAAPEPALLSAAQLAEKLGVSVGYVRAHADELGAVRIGTGTKPRLRFPADAAIPKPISVEAAVEKPRPRRRSQPRTTAGSVLTIRGPRVPR